MNKTLISHYFNFYNTTNLLYKRAVLSIKCIFYWFIYIFCYRFALINHKLKQLL